MGPPGGPIFGTVFRFIFCKFFASGLKKRNVFGVNRNFVAYGDRKATREALLSEAGFEKVFRVFRFPFSVTNNVMAMVDDSSTEAP